MTTSKQTVTQTYLDGIREGRAFMRQYEPTVDEMRDLLQNVIECCRMTDASNPVGQMHRGERDFWRYQLKREK